MTERGQTAHFRSRTGATASWASISVIQVGAVRLVPMSTKPHAHQCETNTNTCGPERRGRRGESGRESMFKAAAAASPMVARRRARRRRKERGRSGVRSLLLWMRMRTSKSQSILTATNERSSWEPRAILRSRASRTSCGEATRRGPERGVKFRKKCGEFAHSRQRGVYCATKASSSHRAPGEVWLLEPPVPAAHLQAGQEGYIAGRDELNRNRRQDIREKPVECRRAGRTK